MVTGSVRTTHHSLILSLFQEGVDPPIVPPHGAQACHVPHLQRSEPYHSSSRVLLKGAAVHSRHTGLARRSPQRCGRCIGLSGFKDIIQLEERLAQHLLAQLQPLLVSELMSQKGGGHGYNTIRWA